MEFVGRKIVNVTVDRHQYTDDNERQPDVVEHDANRGLLIFMRPTII
jgi:hypothetical protein